MVQKNKISLAKLLIVLTISTFICSCNKEIIKTDPVIIWENPIDINQGTLLSITQLNANSNIPGTFVYTPSVGTILPAGLNQNLKVDFTPSNPVNYNSVSKIVKINVSILLNWEKPTDILFGTLLSEKQLNATAPVAGTFVYTPAIGTKLSEGINQELKVDFKPNDAINYSSVSKTVKINVNASLVDIEGNFYKIVTIGTQTWMAENLKTTKYRNGEPINYVSNANNWETSSSGDYCWYNNDEATYKSTYGALYNYNALIDNRNIAPEGWHVPNDAEWNTLITNLGGSTVAGGKMKESGLLNWTAPNTGATNESGFSALPCSYRNIYGTFSPGAFLKNAYWWTSTEANSANAWYYFVQYDNAGSSKNNLEKRNGFSIRCIKGEAVKKDPTIIWANPNKITKGTLLSSIQLNATANTQGSFVYTPGTGAKLNIGNAQDLKVVFTPTDKINYNTVEKTVKIDVINDVSDIDGNVYKTVTIGTQIWMVENLKTTRYNDGTLISNVTNSATWEGLYSGAYCWFNNDPTNYKVYGALYNWYAVNAASNGGKNVCPSGWHVPSDTEWTTLTDYLGGLTISGGKMKETGTVHWATPNTGATNESGFTALAAGYRNIYGTYSGFGTSGYWWSTLQSDAGNAWYYYNINDDIITTRKSLGKTNGFSIRCVKD